MTAWIGLSPFVLIGLLIWRFNVTSRRAENAILRVLSEQPVDSWTPELTLVDFGNKDLKRGTVDVYLSGLEMDGFVCSRYMPGTESLGNCRPREYQITGLGREAVARLLDGAKVVR